MDYKEDIKKIKKLNAKEVSASLKICTSMVRKYKKGANVPPLKNAILLEEKFGIDPRAWIKLNEETTQTQKAS